MNPIIVLGSGLAGYTVVRELRKLNRDIPITLVSRDSGDYYSKPMLSNAFAQNKDAASLVLTPAADMAKQLNIKLLVETEVHAIHRAGKQLDTTSGMLEYDKLVLALGADPIRIPLQGDAAHEVMSVNDLADYAKLREALGTAKSIAIMGGGLIGCEFANDLADCRIRRHRHRSRRLSARQPDAGTSGQAIAGAAGQTRRDMALRHVRAAHGQSGTRATRLPSPMAAPCRPTSCSPPSACARAPSSPAMQASPSIAASR